MVKKILYSIVFLCLISFISLSFAQVPKKDGIFYRDIQSNPKSLKPEYNSSKSLPEQNVSTTSIDTITLLKPDFLVNTLDGNYGAIQNSVSAAIDGNGNYACTWIDYRNGRKQIFAQFFNSNDEKIGSNFIVNENPVEGNNKPFIAANKNGDFVITWLQNFSYVMAQRLTKEGQKIGANFQVNTTWAMNTMEPSAAVNNDGSFLIMWSSDQNYQVLVRLFDKNGSPLTYEIVVSGSDLKISSSSWGKHAAVDSIGNYCVVWSARVNYAGSSNIYYQKIDSAGNKIGSNIMISDSSDSSDDIFPEIVAAHGHFMAVWDKEVTLSSNAAICARIFNFDDFITNEMIINTGIEYAPSFNISSDKDSTFIISFMFENNPYIRKIGKTGRLLGAPEKMRFNNAASYNLSLGCLTEIYLNHFYSFHLVYERSDQNIYVSKFDFDINHIGDLHKVNDDYYSAWQTKSFVHFNNRGESIVVWEDERNGRSDLYAQVYDKNLNPVNGNIQVNDTDDENHFLVYDKKVTHLSDGTFVIAYSGSNNYSFASNIFLQRIAPDGEKIGSNIHVSEGNAYDDNFEIAINVNPEDDLLICWYNYDGAYQKKYNKNLESLNGGINYFRPKSQNYFYSLAISIDTRFNIFAAWVTYYQDSNQYIYTLQCTFFDDLGRNTSEIYTLENNSGLSLSSLSIINDNKNFAVAYLKQHQVILKRKYFFDKEYTLTNTFPVSPNQSEINMISFDNQKMLFTYSTPYDVYAFYANDNKRKNNTYKLHTYNYINYFYDEYTGTIGADIYDNKLFFTFENGISEGTGDDVWGKVLSLDNINFSEEVFLGSSGQDALFLNYPNPFNTSTKITYEILAFHKVKLAVYDILGREVRVLVDADQEKGIYEINFDAAGLSSGIYFCRLEAFNTTIKKMILLK